MKKIIALLVVLIPIISFAETKQGFAVGDKITDFTLPNYNGENISLYKELEKGAVILTFYRGGWCPVCNRQLAEIGKNLDKINELNAQVIAISPELPTHAEKTAIANNIEFIVLSDKDNKIAKQYNILWEVPESGREGFSNWLKSNYGKSLEDYNNNGSYELPIPATFVVNKDAEIVFYFVDENYRRRADIKDIISALEE